MAKPLPYCGLEGLLDTALELGGDGVAGSAAAGAECEVGAADSDFGGTGAVVIALSGFRRWSLLGPKPNLISARESGTVLLCHPLSAWYRRMASSLASFQVPVAWPLK